MATEDNLRDRAKEIRGAFEPSSVTNEAVGGLLLDIINFFIDYGGNGGGGGKPDARYWSKEELKMLDQYLYVLNDKIKALYADSAGDSELFKGHKWEDYFDQPLHTYDPVKFKSVTSPLFIFNELTTPEFVSGLLGAGTRLKDNHLELDEITVRKRMNVFELFIQRVRAVGGQLLLSPASIKISTVEELENGYKCSFNTDDQTIPEPFVLNDQAFHQTFTGKGINRYWRLTTEAGDDYFVLSKTDCEPGSGIPQPGDEVILLGNRTDKARQSAMMLSAYGNDAPYLDTYDGINDYNLSGKLLTREGNLTGIVDEVFGQLSGSGFYGKNVYLRGKFALSSGVSVDDKFGQTDSQMNNLQGQLTNQQGQLNTQQGQITNIQTDILAIPGQIKQEVSQTVTHEVGNLQIGMTNLLKGSNVELNAQAYQIGKYAYDVYIQENKEYTCVICYTLGSENTYIGVYTNSGSGIVKQLNQKGSRIVESFTFKAPVTPAQTSFFDFYQFPNGTYGSKVHWAVLVEGNKGPNSWIPSQADNDAKAQAIAKAEAELAETKANAYADGIVTEAEQNAINEAQARLDALKIGSVNLVSRKMMLAWNEKNKDIAVWGQDSDGIYLSINPRLLYENIGGSASYNDIFENKIKYKSNTQYVFSIEWKAFVVQTTTYDGLSLTVHYTDGTKESLFNTTRTQSTNTRTDFITQKGKTIQKISCTYGTSYVRTLVYSPALYEGNKVLSEPPVATEDLTWQSNVNLVDGGKEVTVTAPASSTHAYEKLTVPKLKPNTVYHLSFKAENLVGSPTEYTAIFYKKDMSAVGSALLNSSSGRIMITNNNFTEGEEYVLLLYAGVAGSTNGNSVKYTEVMLVEGFTPPSSYSPSPGDVAKDIKDVSDAVSNLDTTINTTFKDGIISEAEAKAIASNINVLNAEKADIDAYYTKLYANAYLTGTAKTNLASAKTAYSTAHEKLIDSINTAIADGKTTATEKADVDAKFSAYNNALSAYQTRVGEADKAIQDTIKKVADDAQTSANTAQSAANAAQSAANQAQADANAANSKLTTWASDNYISPQEKTALRQQKSDIQSEQKDIEANANRYGISLASYMAAYNAAIAALNKYTATSPENIAVSSDYNNISAYYPARQTILNSIATAAKAQVDGVVDTIDKVTTEFNTKIDQKADSVTVSAMRTDLNSLGQVVNQQGSQLQVNTNSIDAIVTKNGSGTIVSIKPEMVEITGTTVIQDGNGNKVHIFGIGDKVISVNGGMFSVDGNGKVIMQNAEIAGKVTAKIGQIGPFTIEELWLRGNNLAMSGSQLNYSYSGHQVYVGSHPDMTTAGGTKLGTFMLSGGDYGGLESDKQVALIVGAPSNNNSYALALTSGLALIKGQVIFDKPTVSARSVVTIGFNSGHFVMLTTITGNSVVSVSAGLPVGSWFLIGQATAAGGYYYIKLSGSERFQRRGNAYQQVNSHNQDPSLIFKISSTSWLIGNLPVNWIDWN